MRIRVPTEIKSDEYRVALTPAGAHELVLAGHEVFVQSGAGAGAGVGSGFADADHERVGVRTLKGAEVLFEAAQLVLKVKEPRVAEVGMLGPHHILFTYLHLAAAPDLADGLCQSGATCIAYETVETQDGRLPLLAPMSEVAGRIAAQTGAFMLTKSNGGREALLAGVVGVAPGRVLVLAAGVVGINAAVVAAGLGAEVSIVDKSIERLREIEPWLPSRCSTHFASALTIEQALPEADLVSRAVLVKGATAPRVATAAQLELMKAGAVMVDVSIDRGGCFETSRPTTHADPVYDYASISHYCVTNMPGAAPVTSTWALTNATLPYVLAIADVVTGPLIGCRRCAEASTSCRAS